MQTEQDDLFDVGWSFTTPQIKFRLCWTLYRFFPNLTMKASASPDFSRHYLSPARGGINTAMVL